LKIKGVSQKQNKALGARHCFEFIELSWI